jgi:hypothetical protein
MKQLNKNVRAALKRLKEKGATGSEEAPAKEITSEDVF